MATAVVGTRCVTNEGPSSIPLSLCVKAQRAPLSQLVKEPWHRQWGVAKVAEAARQLCITITCMCWVISITCYQRQGPVQQYTRQNHNTERPKRLTWLAVTRLAIQTSRVCQEPVHLLLTALLRTYAGKVDGLRTGPDLTLTALIVSFVLGNTYISIINILYLRIRNNQHLPGMLAAQQQHSCSRTARPRGWHKPQQHRKSRIGSSM